MRLVAIILWSLFVFFLANAISEDSLDTEYTSEQGECTCEIEVYGPEVQHGIIKSPNYPNFDGCDGRCIYRILPAPNTSVTLYTSQYQISTRSTIIVYSLIGEDDGHFIHMFHAKIKRPTSYYYSSSEQYFPDFVSAKNVGFEIHFLSHTETYYTNFKISFDRHYEHDEVCDFPIVNIEMEETVIQKDFHFRSASGCVYHVSPINTLIESEEDEMLITIGESDEGVTLVKTRDENGNLVNGDPIRARKPVQLLVSAFNIQIICHKSSRTNGMYKMPKITAKLVKKSCQCDNSANEFDLKQQTSMSIHSPGFPDLFCPNKRCSHALKLKNDMSDDDRMCVFEISFMGTFSAGDSFYLKADDKKYFEITTYKYNAIHLNRKFVIKAQPLEIEYSSDKELKKRFFEMNITNIRINAECFCNFFKDKKLSGLQSSSLEVTFPHYCSFIYCYFDVKDVRRSLIEFQVVNALEGDVVIIKDFRHEEKYKGSILHRWRQHELGQDSDFTFFRDKLNATESTIFRFNFSRIENNLFCPSEPQEVSVGIDKAAIITSPGYPQNYQNDQTCQYIITAPENCVINLSIDEISVENYHDYVKIYKGNTTEGELIKSYTAHIAHQVIPNISGTTVLIVFETDQSTSGRGFHISATASIILENDYNRHFARNIGLIGLGVLFIIAVIVIIFTYEKHLGPWLSPFLAQFRARRGQNAEQPQQPAPAVLIAGQDLL